MTLIKSISGIRGIIGSGLTPPELVAFTSAYVTILREQFAGKKLKVVIGRDARTSGLMVSQLVSGTLMACGADVIDLGLTTTPTVEMAVVSTGSDGGVILTASHNPEQWNALKLLNSRGEFISAEEGKRLLHYAESGHFEYPGHDRIGNYALESHHLENHISRILELPLVDLPAIRERNFRVAFDSVNSAGGIALPRLLEALGIEEIIPLNQEPDGHFAHNPEPLPEHLGDISRLVRETRSDVGFVVDPDVDRLAIVCENGGFFGEEYTLVAVADYVLRYKPGNTVSNLSSTRALRDVTEKHGGQYFASAVGEVNVVEMMKKCNAVIGGEGNGGVIWPDLHYGRDALAGIALFLSHLAKSGIPCSELRKSYPDYFISKNKIDLNPETDLKEIFIKIRQVFSGNPINETDGLRIDFEDGWVHLRISNTEPIIRIYAEGKTLSQANEYARLVMQEILA
jgi:phosphomannomutase